MRRRCREIGRQGLPTAQLHRTTVRGAGERGERHAYSRSSATHPPKGDRNAHRTSDLPYPYDALEPVISAQTLRTHHGKHHRAYVDKVNALVRGTDLVGRPLEAVVAQSARRAAADPAMIGALQQRRAGLEPRVLLELAAAEGRPRPAGRSRRAHADGVRGRRRASPTPSSRPRPATSAADGPGSCSTARR